MIAFFCVYIVSHMYRQKRDQYLGGGKNGKVSHRLAIFDGHGRITQIISQLDVIRLVGGSCCCSWHISD